jgi:hypothetical protein
MSRVAIIDDSDPNIRYNGTWVANTTPRSNNSPEYNGTSHESGDQGGTITYTFTGERTAHCPGFASRPQSNLSSYITVTVQARK